MVYIITYTTFALGSYCIGPCGYFSKLPLVLGWIFKDKAFCLIILQDNFKA